MQAPRATFSPQRPSSTLRLCADCKFYKPVITRQSGLCTLCGDIDLVTGIKTPMLASEARKPHLCAEEGNYYVAGPHQPPVLLCEQDIKSVLSIVAPILVSLVSVVIIMTVVFGYFEALRRAY